MLDKRRIGTLCRQEYGRPNRSWLSTMYSGSISLDADVDVKALPGILAGSLRGVRAKNVVQLPDRVTFTGGVFRFVSSGNVLISFTAGEVAINTNTRRLEYRVSFTQLVVFLALFTAITTAFMLVNQIPLALIPIVLALMWLWIGGVNFVIGIARFESFLRRVQCDARRMCGG